MRVYEHKFVIASVYERLLTIKSLMCGDKTISDEGARGLFVLMFGGFVPRGILRLRQNGAWNEPKFRSTEVDL
jgi:hypothetical protein